MWHPSNYKSTNGAVSPTPKPINKCPYYPACSWQLEGLIGHPKQLCTHINIHHSHELHLIPEQTFNQLKVFPCYTCCCVCSSKSSLASHNTNLHLMTYSMTNLDIIFQTYKHQQNNPTQHQQWLTTLEWLHTLDITPPMHHSSEWSNLQPSTHHAYLTILHNAITWTNAANLPFKSEMPTPDYQSTLVPFFKLLLILKQLLLCPVPKQLHHHCATTIEQPISLFKLGYITELYDTAFTQPCDTSQHSNIPIFDDMSFCPQAQQAADWNPFNIPWLSASALATFMQVPLPR